MFYRLLALLALPCFVCFACCAGFACFVCFACLACLFYMLCLLASFACFACFLLCLLCFACFWFADFALLGVLSSAHRALQCCCLTLGAFAFALICRSQLWPSSCHLLLDICDPQTCVSLALATSNFNMDMQLFEIPCILIVNGQTALVQQVS